jgi:hypothetical protein
MLLFLSNEDGGCFLILRWYCRYHLSFLDAAKEIPSSVPSN